LLLVGLKSLLVLGPAGAQDASQGDPPMPSVHRFSVRALVTVDITGRLVVNDPRAAGEAITRSLTRRRGALLARRPDPVLPGGEIIELILPRGTYADFAAELARLGGWVVKRQAAELPAEIRMVIHVAE
jgi:hypothetical protein